jgi:hypothetical protein
MGIYVREGHMKTGKIFPILLIQVVCALPSCIWRTNLYDLACCENGT